MTSPAVQVVETEIQWCRNNKYDDKFIAGLQQALALIKEVEKLSVFDQVCTRIPGHDGPCNGLPCDDRACVSLPDGSCISTAPCMHNRPGGK